MTERTTDELRAALNDQMAALVKSCKGWDEGDLFETPRMATAIATLANDPNRGKSVLSQMGVRDEIPFISYMFGFEGEIGSPTWSRLVFQRLDLDHGKVSYHPYKNEGIYEGHFLPFDQWWNDWIFVLPDGEPLRRVDLILSLRDQEGGSHFDPKLSDGPYRTVKTTDFAETKYGDQPIIASPSQLEAMMRHLAFEFETSLAMYFQQNNRFIET